MGSRNPDFDTNRPPLVDALLGLTLLSMGCDREDHERLVAQFLVTNPEIGILPSRAALVDLLLAWDSSLDADMRKAEEAEAGEMVDEFLAKRRAP